MEIERRFLLPALPALVLQKCKRLEIQQGYLCGQDNREVRIRKSNKACTLTYKNGEGLVRFEKEIAIKQELFQALWPETEGRQLEKTRYCVRYRGYPLEIDLYKGALKGLILVEVEFKTEQESRDFKVPSFFGREITELREYTNRNLLEKGLPEDLSSGVNGYKIGVLPLVALARGKPFTVLITSRNKGEWIFPRGKKEPGQLDHITAEREAEEEAGLRGEIRPECLLIETRIGLIKYYIMDVQVMEDNWKEKDLRKRKQVPLKEAGKFFKEVNTLRIMSRLI